MTQQNPLARYLDAEGRVTRWPGQKHNRTPDGARYWRTPSVTLY